MKQLSSSSKSKSLSSSSLAAVGLDVAQIIDNDDEIMIERPKETRKVIRIARDLFESSVQHDLSNEVLARAKLRSICGEYESNMDSRNKNTIPFKGDKKMWRLSSWYYLGLHYDVLDDVEASKDCMKMALRQCASSFGNGDDSEF